MDGVLDRLLAPFRRPLSQRDVMLWPPSGGRPRLRVRFDSPGRWAWVLTTPDAVLDSGHADSWAEAMAVGLAALEVASLAGSPT